MRYVLQPIDIAVALAIALHPHATYAALADTLEISTSTAHQAVQRLLASGLVRKLRVGLEANTGALEEFLSHGVRYAFPAHRGSRRRGVPTAHAAPVLHGALDGGVDPYVWSSAEGTVVGVALVPLVKSAARLATRHPALYAALALVDAMRVGTARDREVAGRILADRLEAVHA